MPSMSTTRRTGHGLGWPRVLVLLLVLLVPGTRAGTYAVPAVAVSADSDAVDIDVLDTALRPPSHTTARTAVPPRPAGPAGRPALAGSDGGCGTTTAAPGTPPVPRIPRSVVLRC